MLKEFKEFIMRGNVLDLAVGVIIGGAFSSIVTSLVNNVIMPLIGIILGGIDFTSLTIKIQDAEIQYGMFLQSVIDFLIIAFCIFLMVKIVNKLMHLKKKKIEEGTTEIVKSNEEILLEEIRDLLKAQNKMNKTRKKKEMESSR